MGKYEGISKYLERLDENQVRLPFDRIERIIGDALPRSAYKYNAWWSNDQGSKGRQSQAWLPRAG